MEGLAEEAYFNEKASKINVRKSKFGKARRCGATLRREPETDVYCRRGKRHGEAVILKHYSVTDEWDSRKLRSHCDAYLPDGGMEAFGRREASRNRDRGRYSRSIIADRSTHHTPGVMYSLNKRNRWDLPELLQQEIEELRTEDRDVDVVMVERSMASFSGLAVTRNRADVSNLSSSALEPRAESDSRRRKGAKGKKKKKGPKIPIYSYSSDLLGLSQKRSEDEENQIPEQTAMPEVTYEICTPRALCEYPNYHQDKHGGHYLRETRKRERKAKHRGQRTPKMNDINWAEEDAESLEGVSTCAATTLRERNGRFQIGDWMNRPSEKARSKGGKSGRKARNGGKVKEESVKKTYVVVARHNTEVADNGDNNLTEEEMQAAETALNAILTLDQERTVRIQLDEESFRQTEEQFADTGASLITCGPAANKVHRGLCQPAKYAVEMDLLCPKSWPRCFIALEMETDERAMAECRVHGFPVACVALAKTVVLSEDEAHQRFSDEWRQVFAHELLERSKSTCGAPHHIESIFDAAAASFSQSAERFEAVVTPHGSGGPSKANKQHSNYICTVKRKAAEFAGLFCENVEDVAHETELELFHSAGDNLLTNRDEVASFCGICFVVINDNGRCTGSALFACNHWFCNECWLQHTAYSATRGAPHALQCPASGCSETLDDVSLMSLLPGDVIARHRRLRKEDWIVKSRDYHSCPDCKGLVKVCQQGPSDKRQRDGLKLLGLGLWCECGATWCGECDSAPHWPASCKASAAYQDERRTFYTSRDLITSVEGQRCPFCRLPMQKNGGCNMMTCRCGSTFCWQCLREAGQCMYRCNPYGMPKFEEFALEDTKLGFAHAAAAAAQTSSPFERWVDRRERAGAARRTASKVDERTAAGEKSHELSEGMCAFVDKCVLFCDALRYVLQYLQVQIAYRHPFEPAKLRQMTKVARSLQNVLSCLERHLLNPGSNRGDAQAFTAMVGRFRTASHVDLGKLCRLTRHAVNDSRADQQKIEASK